MYTILIILSIFLIMIAGIITAIAFKQEEKKMENYKEKQLSSVAARQRSQEYEENSVASVLPVQIWSYVIVTLISLLLIIVIAINY